MNKLTGIIFFALVLSIWSCPAIAQNQEESLETLQQRWSELQIQFAKKENEISIGGENAAKLQDEYRVLVAQANELVGRLKSAALDRLKTQPNDGAALRLLMGILVNDVANGREKSVLGVGDQLISLGIHPICFETAAKTERLTIGGREVFEELAIRQKEAEEDNLPRVELETTKGKLLIELYENQAPNTVSNFVALTEAGRFDDIQFHRVIDGFMAQAGQNRGDGAPLNELDYTIASECGVPETRLHFSYCISMALNSDPSTGVDKDSGAGQFFITFARVDRLDGKHTCFGRVIEGADLLERIERTASADDTPIPNVKPDRIIAAKVIRKREHKYEPRKLVASNSSDQEENSNADAGSEPTDSLDAKDSADEDQLELPQTSDGG
jgi:cyclophilin family peptidyl-prolyl cis-trans isomerase